MTETVTILMAEDDPGHAALITRSLRNTGLTQPLVHFRDGQSLLDFLMPKGTEPVRESGASYVLLLDIRMPKVDGIEVLRLVRAHPELAAMPVIVVTTTDDPRDVATCRDLGCIDYIVKHVRPDRFREAMARLASAVGTTLETVPRTPVTRGSTGT
jgi:CheY-like chemotaxis protein